MTRQPWSFHGLIAGVSMLAACGGSGSRNGFDDPAKDGNATDNNGTLGTQRSDDAGASAPTSYDASLWNIGPCDTGGASATDFAKTFGICGDAVKDGFGVVSASFTRGYMRADPPNVEQHAVLPKFGNVIKPREGTTLGVLSSGFAQEFDGAPDKAFNDALDGHPENGRGKEWTVPFPGAGGATPPGYPKASLLCPGILNTVQDLVAVKLTLKAPVGANGFSFDFNFFSSEWPAFVCSPFNDGFIAYLSSKAFNGGQPENISFDASKNPVSVNNGFFDRCTAGIKVGCGGTGFSHPTSTCPGGPSELEGTGFGLIRPFDVSNCSASDQKPSTAGGSTGWLTSKAPIQSGETFTLELMIWDTGDAQLDSSVIVDNFRWIAGPVIPETGRPVK